VTHIRTAFDVGSFPQDQARMMREAYRDACAELAISRKQSEQRRMVALCVREMIDLGEDRKDRIIRTAVVRCRSLGNLIGSMEAAAD